MKTILILAGLLIGAGFYQPAKAQVNVNVNIGTQPLWGPTGYDYVDYYYFPDLDIYYYVPLQQWVYFNAGRWITTAVLPPQYTSYDLYRLHKVVINEKQPYLRNATYRKQYASFRGKYDQQPIRDSRDSKYSVVNNHPMHNQSPGRSSNARPAAGQPGNAGRQQANRGPQGGNNRPQQGEHRDRGPR